MSRPPGSFGKAPKAPIAVRRREVAAELARSRQLSFEAVEDAPPDPSESDAAAYMEARAQNERTRGRLMELELALRRGDLLPRVDVERDAFARGRMLRNRIQGIGPRIAAEVYGAKSLAECQRVLDRELRLALEALADEVRHGA